MVVVFGVLLGRIGCNAPVSSQSFVVDYSKVGANITKCKRQRQFRAQKVSRK